MAARKKSRRSVTRKPRTPRVVPFTREERIAARNAIMCQYIASPRRFSDRAMQAQMYAFESVNGFVTGYGEETEAYLEHVMREMRRVTAVT